MTFGSLFSGIGGLDLGLERAGMVCKWQVEKDEYCQRVLAKHWPGVKRYGDVRELSGSELERVDLIAGGFPCTDTSNAGARSGLDGEHSGLWREMFRIICVARPRLVLVENVPGLLARGMGDVLGDLASIGFDAEWQSLPAFSVGAPHQRYRVFIVAYARGSRPAQSQQTAAWRWGNGGRDSVDSRHCAVALANADTAGLEGNIGSILADRKSIAGHLARCGSAFAQIPNRQNGALESWVLRGVYGIPNRVGRVRALGNAVVPQVAEWIGKRIMEATL